jgi:sulfite reductase alpha subunit-like flavoprotein
VVDYTTPYKRQKKGLCSSYLASSRPLHIDDNTTPVDDNSDAWQQQEQQQQHQQQQQPVGIRHGSSVQLPQQQPEHVAVWVEKGSLRMPTPTVPLVLIGPGTGALLFCACTCPPL